ncbi:MAG: peptidyl-prolyl cis-trans isomerase [Geobacteraceae bacterium]|nr:MAG: peptidyl-prolyl cis-trans isomerase [Geobacteraceae bacterium]
MTRIFKIFFLIVLLASLPATSYAEVIDRIAAIVNDDIITTLEVEKETSLLVKEAEKKAPLTDDGKAKLKAVALDRLIDKKLIEQKIKELDIKVSEEEVRQSMEEVKKQNNLTQENLIAALAVQGLSFDQYKAQLKEQLERLRLMSQEVRSKIQVGITEIMDFYNANRARFGEEDLFRARHIFFKINKDAPAEEAKRVMATAMSVLHEARSGKDFAELAKKYSDDPGAAKDGGELGSFKKGDMLPEIESAVINMKPGEISDLVSTPAGLHIIQLEKKSLGSIKTFDEAKGEIEEILYKKKSEERFNQWVDDLRKGAAIEIKP